MNIPYKGVIDMHNDIRDDDYYCPPVCGDEGAACNTVEIKEIIDVCAPVTVEPSVVVGDVTVSVIDRPHVKPIPCEHWNRLGICKFLVTQKLCVKFPITFRASASANDGLSTDCCDNNFPEPYC
jgi:hypothetical protein